MAEEKNMYHWTDIIADKIIREKGDKKSYTVAAGITPSGVVHIGNFRETITVDLVRRALIKRGKKVRFIYSWDDYDVFRKVPQGMPKPDILKSCLRKSIVDVPDTYGCHKSYAKHNQKAVEDVLPIVDVNPEFIYQNIKYKNGDYAEQIKEALEHTKEIKDILDKYRKEPLAENWLPVTIFCPTCKKDTITELKWLGDYKLSYKCECGATEEIDFRKTKIAKLRWRVDWAMRWAYENVDFEPGGKEHSTPGGSRDTSKEIVETVWKKEAPVYQRYDFIIVKGAGGKMSSSLGNVIDLKDTLEVYEPEIVRYLFAGTRPNREFAISFDTDVLAVYEEFDKVERIYFGLENVNEKIKEKNSVAYELSFIGKIPKTIPYQPSIRHLTTVLQINSFDIEKTVGYFEKELKNEHDKKRLRIRAECAKNWIQKYAPEDFRFHVQDKVQVTLGDKEKEILHQVADKLLEKEWTDKELHEEMYILCKNNDFPPGDYFKTAYRVLINKEKGPRLASFILEIGKEKVAKLFKGV
ncbi:MAG: lysine--tRNA ligase [archaeon]